MFLGTQELFSNIPYSVNIKFRCVRPVKFSHSSKPTLLTWEIFPDLFKEATVLECNQSGLSPSLTIRAIAQRSVASCTPNIGDRASVTFRKIFWAKTLLM
jgi:hypothetical protein